MADLISGEDVSSLTHDAFRSVLNALLIADADLHGVGLTDIDLTTRDTDPDAGMDGWIKWPSSNHHDVLGPGETVLQYKSGQGVPSFVDLKVFRTHL